MSKRLIGVIIIKDGWAVQSFGFREYFPIGDPETCLWNLSNWELDEIMIIDINAYRDDIINYSLLENMCAVSDGTPIIYGGGIKSEKQALRLINLGVERITLDRIISDSPDVYKEISGSIGAQSLIISCPIVLSNKDVFKFNYIEMSQENIDGLNEQKLYASEFMWIDVANEGRYGFYNMKLTEYVNQFNVQSILFGGLSTEIVNKHEGMSNITGFCFGNVLNYGECVAYDLREKINDVNLRKL